MEFPALHTRLIGEAARLRAALAAADPVAKVPSCPEWTAADLLDHVVEVYDDKTQCMRLLREPTGADRLDRPGTGLERFDAALADLLAAFAERGPDSLAYTWYGPDQSVGFWIRRMAQETHIHRVDAELTARQPISPIDPALALDGIDEMHTVMLAWGSRAYRRWVAGTLTANLGLVVALDAGSRAWTFRFGPDGIDAESGIAEDAQATLTGAPGDVLLWLWRRVPVDALAVSGDAGKAAALYDLIAEFAQ